MLAKGLGAIAALGLGVAAWAQAPTVTTLPAFDIGSAGATLNASFTVGNAQFLANPGFETALGPGNWNPAAMVYLEAETSPLSATLLRRTTNARSGVACGELQYRTQSVGLVGVACPQAVSGVEAEYGVPLVLTYWIRHQYDFGTSQVPDHGGLVEVELVSGGLTYRLRYYHQRKGVVPADGTRLCYVAAGNPGWLTWSSYTHQLSADAQDAFGLTAFTVAAVRLGVLARKGATDETRLYWLFDDVELRRGGVVVWHQYRRADVATWSETAKSTYNVDSPTHAVVVESLTSCTAYLHRLALAYEGGRIYGAELAFTTQGTIQVSSVPPEGGSSAGGGTFPCGSLATVVATPNPGWRFVNWTENGSEVSTNLSYAFTVTTSRTLVANFTQEVTYTASVAANPPQGGTVTGGGTFLEGSPVTVRATSNPGWRFVYWTEGGTPVSPSAHYSFSATRDRNLVARFVQEGDANLDGVVDVRDVRLIHQAALGLVTLSFEREVAADLDGDGQITVGDAEILASRLAGCL